MRGKLDILRGRAKNCEKGSKDWEKYHETIIHVERTIEYQIDKMYGLIDDLTAMRDKLEARGEPCEHLQDMIDDYESAIAYMSY